MIPDSRWLEILKSSGWQTAAIAAACGFFLLVEHWGWLPPLDGWIRQLAAFVGMLTGFLTLTAFLSTAIKFFSLRVRLGNWFNRRIERRELKNYIPHMTEKERDIIAYLLSKNQKMFTCDQDGGHAVTLISRRIIVPYYQPNQVVHPNDVPMIIPDHLWEILQKHKNHFPYTPKHGESKAHPWRVSWMVR